MSRPPKGRCGVVQVERDVRVTCLWCDTKKVWEQDTLYTIHTIRYTLYTLYAIHYTHYTLYTLYAIHYTHYTHYTIHTIHTIHTIRYTLYILYAIHTVRYTHYTLYTLYAIHYTRYTLYAIHYTILIPEHRPVQEKPDACRTENEHHHELTLRPPSNTPFPALCPLSLALPVVNNQAIPHVHRPPRLQTLQLAARPQHVHYPRGATSTAVAPAQTTARWSVKWVHHGRRDVALRDVLPGRGRVFMHKTVRRKDAYIRYI